MSRTSASKRAAGHRRVREPAQAVEQRERAARVVARGAQVELGLHESGVVARRSPTSCSGPGARLAPIAQNDPIGAPSRARSGTPGVGDNAELVDRAVVAQPRDRARVLDHQRRVAGDDVLAEGVRQRRLAALGPGGAEPDRAREELAVGVDQRDEHHRDADLLGRHPRDAVEVRGSEARRAAPRRAGRRAGVRR